MLLPPAFGVSTTLIVSDIFSNVRTFMFMYCIVHLCTFTYSRSSVNQVAKMRKMRKKKYQIGCWGCPIRPATLFGVIFVPLLEVGSGTAAALKASGTLAVYFSTVTLTVIQIWCGTHFLKVRTKKGARARM
jgi:hypothetical protein